jgi:hypothetical protein
VRRLKRKRVYDMVILLVHRERTNRASANDAAEKGVVDRRVDVNARTADLDDEPCGRRSLPGRGDWLRRSRDRRGRGPTLDELQEARRAVAITQPLVPVAQASRAEPATPRALVR